MPNGEISQIQLPNGDLYDIRDGNVSDFKTNINEETLSDGQVVKYNEDTGEWKNEEDKTEHVGSASGAVATFTTDAAVPLKSFECNIVAQQASGTPTPVSPLNITGFSQADIGDISDVTNITYFEGLLNGTYGFVDLGTLNWTKVTNTSLTAGMYFYSTMPDRMVGSTNMICSNYFVPDIKGLSNIIAEYGADVDNIIFTTPTTSRANIVDSDYTDKNDLTTALNGVYLIYELATPTTPTITPEQFKSLCLAFGITSDMFIVSFGQTIYGGKLIYQNGRWSIEATYKDVDLSSLAWSYQSAGERFVSSSIASTVKAPPSNDDVANVKCSILQTTYANNTSVGGLDNSIGITSTSKNIVIKATSAGTTQADLRDFLTGCDFIYELATPVIIPLTSTVKVKTISGLNNIYSNTGGVSLEYYKNAIPAQAAVYDNTSSGLTSTDVQSAINELSEHGLEIIKTASGTVALFSDGADNIPVNSFECSIVAQQESGTPTPANLLSIIGFSQADISVCGLNIFDEEMEVGTLNNSTGETEIDANKRRSVNFIPVKPNTTYRVYNNTGVNLYIYSYGVDNSFIAFDNTGMVTGSTFTTDSNTYYIKFRTQNNPSYNNNISINYSSSDANYHAYTGTLYEVSFGQTIYGGRLIYANGSWSIEVTHVNLLLANLTWSYDNVNSRFYATISDRKRYNARLTPFLCTCYLPITDGRPLEEVPNLACYFGGLNDYTFYIHDSNYTDPTIFSNSLGTNTICYQLATPVIIPLTSTVKIKTISGLNNIYSNTGDVSLEYFVNKADDIDKLINAEKSTESSDYHVYSTDEQVVGKWIDGNDIYEKVIDLGAMPNNTTKNIAHGISNLGTVIQAELSASDNSSIWLTIPYATTNTSDTKYQMGFWVTATNIVIKSDWDRSALSGYAILRYTKTSSNTRSLNLSKGSSEELPVEEKKEVKEV